MKTEWRKYEYTLLQELKAAIFTSLAFWCLAGRQRLLNSSTLKIMKNTHYFEAVSCAGRIETVSYSGLVEAVSCADLIEAVSCAGLLEAVSCTVLLEVVDSWGGITCTVQVLQDDRKCAEHGLHDNAQRCARDAATNDSSAAAAAVAAPLFVSRFNRFIGHLDRLIVSWIGFLWAQVFLTVQWNPRKNAVDLLLKKLISSTL